MRLKDEAKEILLVSESERQFVKLPVMAIPENLDNNEDPKRDIHGSNLHGK